MKNKSKYLIYVLIGVVIIALIVISVKYFENDSSESKKESKENTVIDNQEMDFLLEEETGRVLPLKREVYRFGPYGEQNRSPFNFPTPNF